MDTPADLNAPPTRAARPDAPARPLRILVVHNRYRFRGGEDAVVEAEIELLRARGHTVRAYLRHNDEIDAGVSRLQAAAQSVWSARTTADIARLAAEHAPDVVHVHNTLPLVSPSVFAAAHAAGAATVMTLHNFRLLCPQGLLLREGRVCEDCVGRVPWPAVRHGCWRGSRAQTGVVASMLVAHRALGTWQRGVDRYIALNDFCRARFVAGGLPAARIAVKPNFCDLPPPGDTPRDGLLFVGRLSQEKGVAVLAEAWRQLLRAQPDAGPLRIAGEGEAGALLDGLPRVERLGPLPPEAVYAQMRRARALLLPSLWYENFPRTLVEAFGCGTPVIASRLGALAELVDDGRTGWMFAPGDADALARCLQRAIAQPQALARMGEAARALHQRELTGPANIARLESIYADALQQRSAS